MCANLLACSSDTTVHDVEEHYDSDVPMQFGQAAVNAPLTRATTTSAEGSPLLQGFLVSCFKGSTKQTVMDRYEVKFKTNQWENSSCWGYVGKKGDNEIEDFYQDQLQRYWDFSAFPYHFYAISPCPAHDAIKNFTLSKDKLIIPESFSYQTCNNGTPTDVKEPYYVAEATYNEANRVALPFRHIMSKVRFGIYSTKQLASGNFYLSNIKVKVASSDFITASTGYTANLATVGNIFKGTFIDPTKASTDAEKLLLQTDNAHTNDMKEAVDKEHAYFAGSTDGLLQIPQKNVKLTLSFDINGTPYSDIPIAVKDGENTIDSFNWESNKIYTYLINISDLSPLTIDFTAELTPWSDVEGSIDTNLEQ